METDDGHILWCLTAPVPIGRCVVAEGLYYEAFLRGAFRDEAENS
jgi:hypothetical protein